jgi:carboxyl-terminal processing protease
MKFFYIIVVILSTTNAYSQLIDSSFISQKEVIKIANEVSKAIKANALFKDSLNWDLIDKEVQNISSNINTANELKLLYKFFITKLRNVGDNHSFYLTKTMLKNFQNKPKEVNNTIEQIKGNYLGNGIGYIYIPSCIFLGTEKNKQYTKQIQLQIKRIDDENTITGWVIDLRNNKGGDVSPMLAGLNCLIEDGIVAYGISPFHKKEFIWSSLNGKIKGGKTSFRYDNYKVKNSNTKFAILTDSATASSGEIVAISFSGLSNAKRFGLPTGGYTTSNSTVTLSNGDMLFIESSYLADRNHKMFIGKITPDIIIPITDNSKDETLDAAKEWLEKN